MQILFDSQLQYTPNHNPFDTCLVPYALLLIISDDTVKVLSTVSVAEWSRALGKHSNGVNVRWLKTGWIHTFSF